MASERRSRAAAGDESAGLFQHILKLEYSCRVQKLCVPHTSATKVNTGKNRRDESRARKRVQSEFVRTRLTLPDLDRLGGAAGAEASASSEEDKQEQTNHTGQETNARHSADLYSSGHSGGCSFIGGHYQLLLPGNQQGYIAWWDFTRLSSVHVTWIP